MHFMPRLLNSSLAASSDLSAAFSAPPSFRFWSNGSCSLLVFLLFARTACNSIVTPTGRSAATVVASGVSQGSVLGPLLFVMYTTTLSELVSSTSINHHPYVDNTQLKGLVQKPYICNFHETEKIDFKVFLSTTCKPCWECDTENVRKFM